MGLRLKLQGSVQGVGFRPWVALTARSLGVRGSVANVYGAVRIDAFGTSDALSALQQALLEPPLPGACVESLEARPLSGRGPACFDIVESRVEPGERVLDIGMAPDLPTCRECLAELSNPASRRYRYPFIACARCGPRYSMARDLPYDRIRTAMADFPLCAECESEYCDPEDRRFHAESTSCPACGPSLRCIEPNGRVTARGEPALGLALDTLRAGGSVAVLGVGGFHLACDASSEIAVRSLRERKHRARKPLAVMLSTLAEAEKHAVIDDAQRALLLSTARPIVLLRWRDDSSLASCVAPASPVVGLMLAYSPLHELLLQGFGGPLVMTSANTSGEPIAHRPEHLGAKLADLVLAHDREVVAPCDDSVVQSAPSGPIVLRRSRGHVPRPLRLPRPLRHAVLACGGQWSQTICVARGTSAWPSAHVGDIESPASVERLEQTVSRWLDWLGMEPGVVAHDLHPAYETTRFARAWLGKAQIVGVQHHHAHMAAVLGEHGIDGPALGLTWDGTGAGLDGTAWGGELLLGDARSVRRLATFRPIALAGGERAIREPWRLALALLRDAYDGAVPVEALDLLRPVSPIQLERVSELLSRPGLVTPAHGVGRYFDAIGALLLQRFEASYQGELAQGLNFLASGAAAQPYSFELHSLTEPWEIDLRPAIRELVNDLLDAEAPSKLADRFHATLVAAGEAAVREALDRTSLAEVSGRSGRPRLALAGGCFQNHILIQAFERSLGAELEILRPRLLPAGDGGLAFGQALVADAVASAVVSEHALERAFEKGEG